MNKFEEDYRNLITSIQKYGSVKENRTGTSTLSLFNQSLTIDLSEGFPVITGKKIYFDKAEAEYKWMMMGLSTTTFLHDNGIKWWDPYADANGDLRITYGTSLRAFGGETDQLDYAIREINSNSRRAHISLWEAHRLEEALLPPCLTGFTFHRDNDRLNVALQLRSSDVFLGLPFDIIMTALMLIDMAKFCDLKPNLVGIQITDAHLYFNHTEGVKKYLEHGMFSLPTLYTAPDTRRHFLMGYKSGPYIETKMNN